MPIKRDLRWFYPIDWKQLSSQVRFGRAGGACEHCGRPHGQVVRCLPDGRWFDGARQGWRSGHGQAAEGPEVTAAGQFRETLVSLATAHLDHDPGNNRMRNLRALCQRCHMLHDRSHHLARRWITYRLRCALGDLFLGPYHKILPHQVPVVLQSSLPRTLHGSQLPAGCTRRSRRASTTTVNPPRAANGYDPPARELGDDQRDAGRSGPP